MAANDFRVLKGGFTVHRFRTESNTTLGLAAGDLMMRGGTGGNYAVLVTDGAPTQGTDLLFGLSKSGATNTASADCVIDVLLVGQGTILEGKATTTANVNTDAKLLALLNDYVNCDRSAATAAGVLTIDEDQGGTPATLSFCILDGDIVTGKLRVAVCSAAFWEGTV